MTTQQFLPLSGTLQLCAGIGVIALFADGHDEQRLWQLALYAVLAAGALLRGLPGLLNAPEQRGLRWSLAGFFACGAVSALFAFSARHALLEMAMLLMLLLASLFIAQEISRNRTAGLALVLQTCAIGCAAYALKVALLYTAAVSNHIQPGVEIFAPGFSNYRFLNHAQTVALPLLVLLCVLVKSRIARCGVFALTAFWWALLFLTTGRGTMIGIAAGCVVALVLRRRHAYGYCKAMVVTACGGLAIYALLFALLPMALGLGPAGLLGAVAQRTAIDPTSARLPLWTRALELIAAHPVLGAGPMHFGHYAIDIQNGAHPHNWILQIGAEWGIPGLLFLCAAIGYALRSLLRTAPRIAAGDAGNQHMLAAWIAIGAAILVDGLVSGLLVMPVSQLWIALYIGCAAGWTLSLRGSGSGGERRRANLLPGAVLMLLAAAGIAIGVAPELPQRVRNEPLSAREAAMYNGYGHPRIWLAGYF
ncbi:O-antigen ligase family protein [Massilia sp. R2A-15]|uniref:O-antigen ligase family protein n=1 Tax=Massilia sp. R2A-15 TaxID=3064278 RepID=UPI0027360FE6|nr:O-antigen ligase family protein [Massilia sp. R2A-15]WLI88596.1 O-antigen ligase family protein [Massilia sp. R2A-15]